MEEITNAANESNEHKYHPAGLSTAVPTDVSDLFKGDCQPHMKKKNILIVINALLARLQS